MRGLSDESRIRKGRQVMVLGCIYTNLHGIGTISLLPASIDNHCCTIRTSFQNQNDTFAKDDESFEK